MAEQKRSDQERMHPERQQQEHGQTTRRDIERESERQSPKNPQRKNS
jgi:hypothetical protein